MITKIELIKEIYKLDDNDLPQRKTALEKIKPSIDEIMDRFYEKLLEKEEFAKFIPVEKIPELKAKQIRFVAELLSKPFDEKLYKAIAKVAVVHYHIRLDPLSMSYGYHRLSELILAQSKKDPSLLPYMKLIIKYLKVSEAIMGQEYFAQKSLAESPYRANDLFVAVNELHMAYMRYRHAFETSGIDSEAQKMFERRLENLRAYRDVLEEAGIRLSTLKRFNTELAEDGDEKHLISLRHAIEKPLNDLSVTSYLSLASALGLLRSLTEIVYQKAVTSGPNPSITEVKKNITDIFGRNFGWAIEEMLFLGDEPESGYEIVKHLMYRDRIFYLCINVKEISNRLYVLEALDLLGEAAKLTLYVRSKER